MICDDFKNKMTRLCSLLNCQLLSLSLVYYYINLNVTVYHGIPSLSDVISMFVDAYGYCILNVAVCRAVQSLVLFRQVLCTPGRLLHMDCRGVGLTLTPVKLLWFLGGRVFGHRWRKELLILELIKRLLYTSTYGMEIHCYWHGTCDISFVCCETNMLKVIEDDWQGLSSSTCGTWLESSIHLWEKTGKIARIGKKSHRSSVFPPSFSTNSYCLGSGPFQASTMRLGGNCSQRSAMYLAKENLGCL